MRSLWPMPLRLAFTLLLAFVSLAQKAEALNPNKGLSQYVRDAWGPGSGFPGGAVHCLAQTPDGYLWIGAEEGLVRFDGVSFRLIAPPPQPAGAVFNVVGLATDAEGSLWIRLQDSAILRYRNGNFETIVPHVDTLYRVFSAMQTNAEGHVILMTIRGAVFRFDGSQLQPVPSASAEPSGIVISMAQTPDGTIWQGTRDSGLDYVSDGRLTPVIGGLPDTKINTLLPAGAHGVWVGTDNGVVRWDGHAFIPATTQSPLGRVQALTMALDRDQNLWIGTPKGLMRVNPQGASMLSEGNIGSSGTVTCILEDREGDLWAGGTRGVVRLRDSIFATYSEPEGLPSSSNGPVFVDEKGRTWFAPIEGGLFWLDRDRVGRITQAGLDKDIIYSIAGGQGGLWVGRQTGGLTHLHDNGSSFTAKTYTHRDGLAQNSVYTVHLSRDGSVWAGTLSGGVSVLRDGHFTTYSVASGLLSNTVASIVDTIDGTTWFGTAGGLTALADGHWKTYVAQDGLPSDEITDLFEDAEHVLWIGTTRGVAFLKAGSVHVPHDMPEALQRTIFAVAEDRKANLWITTGTHLMRVDRGSLMRGVLDASSVQDFGLSDGLLSIEGVRRSRSIAADATGQLWFSMSRGLSVTDPLREAVPPAQAIAHIEDASDDGASLDPRSSINLPAASQRIVFNYSGVNLSIPERVRFRYRLDGFDHDWSPTLSSREAVYTNLNPGRYTFRVRASSTDGSWNGPEAVMPFVIDPALWQKLWFRVLCLAAAVIAVVLLFRLRMLQVATQLNIRFEERLAERTRIAQELHDTLLQGCLSASMQLDVAYDNLPSESPVKPLLGRVLQLMRQVVDEGRNALLGLRSSDRHSDDLEEAFDRIARELAIHEKLTFRLHVQGEPRSLHPLIRDEVYRIGREALVNAFRHANAGALDVIILYAPNHLRLDIQDDGRGIEEHVMLTGREGHWGISGMRERAQRIGARLGIHSRPQGGTEVVLLIPATIAFQSPNSSLSPHSLSALFARAIQWLKSLPAGKNASS